MTKHAPADARMASFADRLPEPKIPVSEDAIRILEGSGFMALRNSRGVVVGFPARSD